MPQRIIQVSNKLGLHARASAKLTKLARRVNAKSIMGVMMLAAGIGSTVTVDAEGDQADIALDAVQALFDDKFGEGE